MFQFVKRKIIACFDAVMLPILLAALPWIIIFWLIELGNQAAGAKIKREKDQVEKTPPIQL